MKNKLRNIQPVDDVDEIPNGRYDGRQSGCDVTFRVHDRQYSATADVGLRGINEVVEVSVRDGQFCVQAKLVDG